MIFFFMCCQDFQIGEIGGKFVSCQVLVNVYIITIYLFLLLKVHSCSFADVS